MEKEGRRNILWNNFSSHHAFTTGRHQRQNDTNFGNKIRPKGPSQTLKVNIYAAHTFYTHRRKIEPFFKRYLKFVYFLTFSFLFFSAHSNRANWTWKTLPLWMMLSHAWMSTVITTCKKVIRVNPLNLKSFLKIPPKNQPLNQKPKILLHLLHLKMIRMIWRNMLKSRMFTVWMASLDPLGPIQPFSILPMMAPHQHPSPTVRRDIDVIKDQVHIRLLFCFILKTPLFLSCVIFCFVFVLSFWPLLFECVFSAFVALFFFKFAIRELSGVYWLGNLEGFF